MWKIHFHPMQFGRLFFLAFCPAGWGIFFFFCIFLLFVNTILCQDWQDSLASVITGERSVDFAATLLILLRIENSALYMPKKYIYILNQN